MASAELATLEAVRYSNDLRSALSREFVGGIYFLVGVDMLVLVTLVSILQAYVVPVRKLAPYFDTFDSPLGTTIFFYIVYALAYYLSTIFGGMTGWIVCSCLLIVWTIALLIIWCARKMAKKAELRREMKRKAEEEDRDAAEMEKHNQSSDGFDSMGHLRSSADFPEFGAAAAGGSGEHGHHRREHPVTFAASGAFGANTESFAIDESMDEPKAMKKVEGIDSFSPGHRRMSTKKAFLEFAPGTGLGHKSMRRRSSLTTPAKPKNLGGWTFVPDGISSPQRTLLLITTAFFLLIIAVIWCILIGWQIETYQYVDRSGEVQEEVVPLVTAQTLQCMYAFPEIATAWKLDLYVKWFTEYCGTEFRKQLSHSEREQKIGVAWVAAYGINMSLYIPNSWANYSTVNDFITRRMDLNKYRPQPEEVDRVISVADARTLIYVVNDNIRMWLKGYYTSYSDILGGVVVGGTPWYFENGAAVISRLSPQDYHRFHAPVAGSIEGIHVLEGTLWSVGPDASGSGNDVLLNKRTVIIINAGSRIGYVAVIAIGATCLGSIQLENYAGEPLTVGGVVERGDQLGFIQFGGSTIVSLFPQNRIVFNENMIYRSRFPVETQVQVNEEVGYVRH